MRMSAPIDAGARRRRPRAAARGGISAGRALTVEGVVQGVGFRPFVWRLATELGLSGRVRNAAGRVEIEAAGPPDALETFARRLRTDAPPRARVERVAWTALDPGAAAGLPATFAIDESVDAAAADRLFPPDIATCDECLNELADPRDRRYRYPFTNCTNCGPRATIIDELPYDRARTTMRDFPLCAACAAEYADPANRRFHAEPVACPKCGPRLAYRRTEAAAPGAHEEAALAAAAADLRAGRVVAVKGLGGYHLACDATDAAAVGRLRDRKRRWAKPFAIMVRDLDAARALCHVTATEAALLTGPARPIVLLVARRRGAPALAASVAAGNRRLGIFLPYTPLHHLLLEVVGRPLVLTSGNLTDEPLATDDADAAARLAGLADAFLTHDREIRARYDDSVTRVVAGRESLVRRARGHAPEAIPLPVAAERPILAVGAELKHTFTLARGARAHVAPHNGDLEDLATHRAFTDGLAHLSRLLALEPEVVAHDIHPEYLSTKYAVARFPADRRIAVQHHHAHVASCAAEHGITSPFLGVAYDGLGMGDDGTLWGGEVFVADLVGYRRVARFGRAPLPGGALAVRRPYRMALGYLLGAEALGTADSAGIEDARGLEGDLVGRLPRAPGPARGGDRPNPGRARPQRPRGVVCRPALRRRREPPRPAGRRRVRGAGRHRPGDRCGRSCGGAAALRARAGRGAARLRPAPDARRAARRTGRRPHDGAARRGVPRDHRGADPRALRGRRRVRPGFARSASRAASSRTAALQVRCCGAWRATASRSSSTAASR